jgi:hypothetical protein
MWSKQSSCPQVRQLARETYGSYAPDYNHWEILGDTDLDTDTSTEEDEDSDVTSDSNVSGGIMDSSGSDIYSSDSESDSSGSHSSDSLSEHSGWITDSGSDSSGGSDGGDVAQMLMGGAMSGTSGDDDDWDPGSP